MPSRVYVDPHIRASIPLYAAGLLSSAMGLVALNVVLSTGEFTLFSFTLITIGFCTSWCVRARLISSSTLAGVTLIILLATLAAIIVEPEFRYQLVPAEVLEAPDLLAAIVLASLMVVYSFRLATDRSVLFMCVPSLSLIGLLATADPTTEMLTYFGIYAASTSFALVRENALSGKGRKRRNSIKLDASLAAGLTLAALAIGSLVGTLVYPLIAGVFMARISELETTQMIDMATEEFVPIATGPISLSDQELMTVKCDRPLLWRERTYNKYTGQGWGSSLLPQEQDWIRPVAKRSPSGRELYTFRIVDLLQTRERSSVEVVNQTFHVTSGAFTPVLVAAEAETISFERWHPRLRISSGIEAPRYYRKGDTYHVVSKVSVATPRQLRTASNVYPEVIKARYLGTPQSCWQVEKLTSRITEMETTPLQKAQAIQTYLSANYTYDTNAPAAPSDKDAVTYFLFQSRRGYCDIFASAMVVMCRQADIPARWAIGFAPGVYDATDRKYHLRVMDRHAWAEVYFPEYGWIPFDITPAQKGSAWLARVKESWTALASDKASVFAGGLILILIAYLFKTEVIGRIRLNRRKSVWRSATSGTEIGECYQRMCRILAGYGHPRTPAMTPLEYAAMANNSIALKEISKAVDFLTAGFVEFRYSDRSPAPDAIEQMKVSVQALAKTLKRARREKLLIKQ